MTQLFDPIEAMQPDPWLIETLAKAQKMPATNEKAKAERIYIAYTVQCFWAI